MRSRALALSAGILLLGLMPGSVLAVATLDQSNNPMLGVGESNSVFQLAQTFTAGKTGVLGSVDLSLNNLAVGPQTQPVHVYIYAVDGSTGLPTGESLDASQVVPSLPVSDPAWVSFPLSGTVKVTSGTQYAIVFDTGVYVLANGSDDTYSGGKALVDAGVWAPETRTGPDDWWVPLDFAFHTYVDASMTPATYHPLSPTRVLDTRNGTGGLSGPFTNHAARTFTVTGGSSGVPAGATAVTGNLTVTGQTSSGYLFIGPVATNNPGSSTLNFPAGDDRANAVTVALGAGGTLSITFVAPSDGPTAHAIFDVTGYFTPDATGATYHALTPTRIFDNRAGTAGSGPLGSHAAREFLVRGMGGVPASAIAVTGNLTVTGQTSNGYLFLGPAATNNPGSSTLNFPVGDDRANAVTVALSGTGTLSVTFVAPNNGPTANAIFDVTGYFTPDMTGSVYVPLSPARVLDSRNGTGGLSGPFTNHFARTFGVSGAGGVPAGATAVTGNLTVTGQTSKGYLFMSPLATNNPGSSTLNFPVGDDRANAVTIALGAGGSLSITFVAPSNGPSANAIFDVTGYFVAAVG